MPFSRARSRVSIFSQLSPSAVIPLMPVTTTTGLVNKGTLTLESNRSDRWSQLVVAAGQSAPVFEGNGPFTVHDWDVGNVYQGKSPEQKWLVKDTFPLGKAGLHHYYDGF